MNEFTINGSPNTQSITRRWQIIENTLIVVCIITSMGVMIGWMFGSERILSILPGSATMKFNSALVLFISSVNLTISHKQENPYNILRYCLAVPAILIGMLSLLEYSGLTVVELDNLFVVDTLSENYPGRMSPATSLCCMLVGFGFISLYSPNKIFNYTGQSAASIVMVTSMISLIAYCLLIQQENKTHFFKTMAIHTSALFMVISFLLLFKNPYSDFKKVLSGRFAGSKIMRKILPLIVLLPLILCYILIEAIDENALSSDFGLVTFAVIFIPLSILYLSLLAKGLNKTDIERQKLEAGLKQFKDGLDQVSIVAITDSNGIINYVNDKFCEISKYSREELLGKTHHIVNSGHHPKAFFKNMWGVIKSGEIWVNEIKNKAKDGSYYWVYTAIVPFKNEKGEIVEFFAIRQDITKLKEALERVKSELVKNEFKNKELEQFAYVASHDLQEPLRTIMSFTELLGNNPSQGFSEIDLKGMRYIKEASGRMSLLIKSLLDYSRIDKQKELVSVDCNNLLDEIKQDLSKKINETGAEISIGELPLVIGHETPLRLLFQNLISNAIKFCKKDAAPQINLSAKLNNNTEWQFSIQDNGIGIEEKYKKKIFVIFQRLHGKSEYEGTGIGLAHCQKIVDLHGGKIWIDSQPDVGSTFHFTIPIKIQ